MERKLAKVTSKGQVTVPKEVRDALGVHAGDSLVFETRADYAVVRRVPSIKEVSVELKRRHLSVPERPESEKEAIAAYIRERFETEDLGDFTIVGRGGERRPGEQAKE